MQNLANLAASAWQMIEIEQGGGKRRPDSETPGRHASCERAQ